MICLLGIFLIGNVDALSWNNNTFNNSLTSENLTFQFGFLQYTGFNFNFVYPSTLAYFEGGLWISNVTTLRKYYTNGTYTGTNINLNVGNTDNTDADANDTTIFITDNVDTKVYLYNQTGFKSYLSLANSVSAGKPANLVGIALEGNYFWALDSSVICYVYI